MKLNEVIECYISGDWGNEEPSSNEVVAVSCIRGADIMPIRNYNFSEIPTRYISSASLASKGLKEGDIVIEKSGGSPTQSTGRVVYISKELLQEKQNIVCTNFCVAIRIKKEWDPFYIYNYLLFVYNLGVFFNFEGKTSGLKNLDTDKAFDSIPLNKIDIEEQKKIAAVLRSLDDKIMHNDLLCSHLEHIAHELFNYYFNNTYFNKSTENGWVRKNILQLCEATRGVTYGKDDLLPDGTGGILVLRGNNIQNDSIVFDNNVAYVSSSLVSSEQHIYTNDILITMSSGSKEHLGKCAMFHYDSPHTYGAFLSKFSPKGDYAHFVWGIVSSDYFKQSIKTMSNGTGINNLSADILERIYFWFPPEPIMKDFEFAATPLYNQMGIYEQENICLKEEKQRLLSLLLSGTLSVE